jgi:hypothetical protein
MAAKIRLVNYPNLPRWGDFDGLDGHGWWEKMENPRFQWRLNENHHGWANRNASFWGRYTKIMGFNGTILRII